MNINPISILAFLGRSTESILREIHDTERLIAWLENQALNGHEVTGRLISARNHLKYLLNLLK